MTSGTMIVRRTGEGPSHSVLGMKHDYLLLASESGGRYMTYIMTIPPGCGAPLHFHDADCESFYILDGEVTAIEADGTRSVVRAGDFVWFGANHSHSFANESKATARALIVQSPGLEAERFFNEMVAAEASGSFDPMRDVPIIGRRHGVRVAEMA